MAGCQPDADFLGRWPKGMPWYHLRYYRQEIISEEEYNMLLELADNKGEIPKDILLDFIYSEDSLVELEEKVQD